MRDFFPLTGLSLVLWLQLFGVQAAEAIGGTTARIDKTSAEQSRKPLVSVPRSAMACL